MITISVGQGEDVPKFKVHKEFAIYHSPALKAAFNSSFVEGQTQEYCLHDINEEVARLFTTWLYTQKVEVFEEDENERMNIEDQQEEYTNLSKL